MANGRQDWIVVHLDGLGKVLVRRGKHWVINELYQNAADENVTRIDIKLTRPVNGSSTLTVTDDSPEGYRDLSDAYTMYGESYKKRDPGKRGFINVGEKNVLALCTDATISTTTGEVYFTSEGRRRSDKRKRMVGSEFKANMRLTLAEYDEMCAAAKKLIPPVTTFFNDVEIPNRKPIREWPTTLETVISDAEGNMRRTERLTTLSAYQVLEGETAHLYEMGIPVVELNAKYHVSVAQKVPLNADRDNAKPSYLKTIYVELLNNTKDLLLDETDANADWARIAASDPRCEPEAIRTVMDLRFGPDRVSYDVSDVGANREAASNNWTVVSGGSMSAGEWQNAKMADAIKPAGALFPTNLGGKIPAKVYQRNEWTASMIRFAEFVGEVSPELIGGKRVSVRYIKDHAISLCGSFAPNTSEMTVNLAHHLLGNWQKSIERKDLELLIHELAHDAVQTNDHLCREFYDATCTIGAKLAMLAISKPEVFERRGWKLDKDWEHPDPHHEAVVGS